jgi:mycothiol synthase
MFSMKKSFAPDAKLKLNMECKIALPANFHVRPAAWIDIHDIVQLIYASCKAAGDITLAASADDLRRDWHTPGFSLETDSWVVADSENRPVAYQDFVNQHAHASLGTYGHVHPQFTNLGIGTFLLAALDERAKQEIPVASPDARVFLRNRVAVRNASGRKIHEAAGFKPIRFSWRMEITLANAPQPVSWPSGVEVLPFILGKNDHAIYEAEQEAFADHWDHARVPYEKWEIRRIKRENFDSSLWHVAWAGNEIAGFSLCRYRQGIGWVGTLGVRRPWRKHGLGYALLLRSFAEFYKRGQTVIGLNVDASNPTGATRLYERAGMHVASEHVIYEKEYRPGKELEE